MPVTGELVICDMCGKTYKYFVWHFASDKHFCRGCVHKRPMAYLDNIDAIDIDKEHDIIYDEIEEQHRLDYPLQNFKKERVKDDEGFRHYRPDV